MQICIFKVEQYHVCYDDDWLRITLENELHKASKSNLFCLIFFDKVNNLFKVIHKMWCKEQKTQLSRMICLANIFKITLSLIRFVLYACLCIMNTWTLINANMPMGTFLFQCKVIIAGKKHGKPTVPPRSMFFLANCAPWNYTCTM